jgi:hypothetical protein
MSPKGRPEGESAPQRVSAEGSPVHARLAAVALCCAALAAPVDAAAQAPRVTPFSQGVPGTMPPPGWAAQTFPRIASHTRYALVRDGDTVVVRAEADASASGLVHRLAAPAAEARVLRWRWKVDRLPQGADTSRKAADDAPARVYVTFRHDPARLGPVDRLLYEAARVLYGEAPPHASLMYVWDAAGPAGRSFANPFTSRVQTIVVEGGRARLGQWLAYERDILADYRAAFGEDPPPVSGVAIMTDADNTGDRASAWFGDVTLDGK